MRYIPLIAIILIGLLVNIANGARTFVGNEGFRHNAFPDYSAPGWSVAGWVYLDSVSSAQTFFSMTRQAAADDYISVQCYSSARLRFTARDGASETQDSSYTFTAGEWAHFAVTWRVSDNQVHSWINGKGGNTGTCTTDPDNFDRVTLGYLGDSSPGYAFEGSLDNVVFWNADELTAANVRDLYTRRWSGEVIGTPLCSWRLAEGTADANALDQEGNYELDIVGTPDPCTGPSNIIYTAGDPTGTTFYVCDVNGSDTYDGTSPTFDGVLVGPRKTIEEGYNWLFADETLQIRTGVYYNETIDMSNGVGGVTIEPYGNESVEMSGGVLVTGWTQCAADDPNLKVDGVNHPNATSIYWAWIATGDVDDPNQLQLSENNVLARYACFPDMNFPYSSGDFYSPSDNGTTTTIIDTVNLTGDPNDYIGAHVVIWSRDPAANISYWTDEKVSDFNSVTDTATISGTWHGSDVIHAASEKYMLYNRPQWLDETGEVFWLTTAESGNYKIFYWPNDSGVLETGIEVAKTARAFLIPGTCDPNITVKNMTISNYDLMAFDTDIVTGLDVNNVDMHCMGRPSVPYGESVITNRAMYIEDCTSGLVLRDLTAKYCWSSGITLDGCDGFRVYDPNVMYTQGTCFQLKTTDNYGAVIGGYFYGTGSHGNAMSIYGTCKSTLIMNLTIYDKLTDTITYNSADGIILYNCVLDLASDNMYPVAYWSGTYTNCRIYNSLMTNTKEHSYVSVYFTTMDANCVMKNCVLDARSGKSNTDVDYVAYLDSFSSDPNSLDLTGVALGNIFTDAGNNDYTLAANSNLINAGVNLSQELADDGITGNYPDIDFNKDILGNSRIGAWDIGPYEYQSPVKYLIGSQ